MTAFLYVSPGPLDHLDQKAMGMADWNDQDDLSSPSPTLLASGQSKKVTFPRTWTMVQEERFDWTHVKGEPHAGSPGTLVVVFRVQTKLPSWVQPKHIKEGPPSCLRWRLAEPYVFGTLQVK